MEHQPRHELKYIISTADAPALQEGLERTLKRDINGDQRNSYQIRSLYFDDAYNSAYWDKLDGVMHRDKYRIRMYGLSDDAIYLERKRKAGDLIIKDSQRVTRRLAQQLMDGEPRGLEKLEHPLFQEMFREMRLRLLRPAVIVEYDRRAYTYPALKVRVTFDRDVRAGAGSLDLFAPRLPTVPAMEPGQLVLEVKYDFYLPDFIPPLLSSIPAQRSAVSKYTLCRRYT